MRPVLVILGPTCVGKTGASILLAQELRTEIISADSMQVYRGMDIGTAKPSLDERALVKHHLIDIVDPDRSFSAGQYVDMIVPLIDGLHSTGKVPIVTGGTGLYIKALTRGIFSGPSADWSLRERLIGTERSSPGSLYAELASLDPEAASTIEKTDIRRIVRALEVCLTSHEKISRLRELYTKPLPYDFIKIGLIRDRAELYRLIDSRVDEMLAAGLADEARSIMKMNPDRTPLQAIGYKEFIPFFNGMIPMDEAVRLVKRNTRRYAKRQLTWFRKEEGIRWIDLTGIRDAPAIFSMIKAVIDEEFRVALTVGVRSGA